MPVFGSDAYAAKAEAPPRQTQTQAPFYLATMSRMSLATVPSLTQSLMCIELYRSYAYLV